MIQFKALLRRHKFNPFVLSAERLCFTVLLREHKHRSASAEGALVDLAVLVQPDLLQSCPLEGFVARNDILTGNQCLFYTDLLNPF